MQPNLVDRDTGNLLIDQVRIAQSNRDPKRKNLRNVFDALPSVRRLVTNPDIAERVLEVLGPDAFAVRAIVFDKTPEANWRVAWHQDTAIPLREPGQAPGFGPPSTKDGVAHTRAPASLLERMLTVRLHLDDCYADNGPLRVIPGSHRLGRLDDHTIATQIQANLGVAVTVPAAGALFMRPLLLHSSSPAIEPSHRRVIHIEFSADDLPSALDWHTRIPLRSPMVSAV
ncbi:MAG: phytanoyl-CoA dioxygenase family protein [Planctomycetota bacterium]